MSDAIKEPVAGVLLAGGRSSRIGGGDKCLLQLRGKPLLTHAIERLEAQVSTLVLNANGDPKRFASFGLPVIGDGNDEQPGPLAGVLAGMEWADAEAPDMRFIVTVPIDTPFFPDDLVARLVGAQQGREVPAIAASDSGEHPVFGIWPVALAATLRRDLASGLRKTLDWAHAQGAVTARFAPARIQGRAVEPFFNINEAKDLAEAEALLTPR
ncbi:MAG TPA: molybdenum cofactor guanylyltransferase MobA [Methyloceanibacter sp.]|jgi:molybdopterin-guanine dinucleotide biosynthesis protein A